MTPSVLMWPHGESAVLVTVLVTLRRFTFFTLSDTPISFLCFRLYLLTILVLFNENIHLF